LLFTGFTVVRYLEKVMLQREQCRRLLVGVGVEMVREVGVSTKPEAAESTEKSSSPSLLVTEVTHRNE
jgi:hypothetical protein